MESNAAAGRSLRYAAIMNRSNILKAYAAAFLKNLQFFGPISVPYFLDWLRVDYTKMFILQAWFLFWVFLLEIPNNPSQVQNGA